MIRIQVVGMMIFEANENIWIRTITVWWFGTWILCFHISGIVILTDELIFFRGVGIPPTRIFFLEMSWDINNQQDDQLILIQCDVRHMGNSMAFCEMSYPNGTDVRTCNDEYDDSPADFRGISGIPAVDGISIMLYFRPYSGWWFPVTITFPDQITREYQRLSESDLMGFC